MFTKLSKIPIKLGILLVGFGLLVVGCDSAGTNGSQDDNQNNVEEEVAFEAVDGNLADRITYYNESSSNSVTTAAQKNAAQKSAPGFSMQVHVAPQSGQRAASHLALSKDPSDGSAFRNLYVGYKTPDGQNPSGVGDYGGGIEILGANPNGTLDASPHATSNGDANVLVSDDVDVQELAVADDGTNPDVLYAATAVDPDVTLPRAPQLHSIKLGNDDGLPDGTPTHDLVELLNDENTGDGSDDPTKVAKSVVVDDYGINAGNAFAVSDEDAAHAINVGTPQHEIDEDATTRILAKSSDREYRSVTQMTSSGTLYALGYNGHIYELDFSSAPDGESQVSTSNLGSFGTGNSSDNDKSIARLSSYDWTGVSGVNVSEELLLVAMNDDGFRIYSPNSGSQGTRYKDTDIYATSVTATDNYVYVASGNGIAVYEVRDLGSGPGTGTGLEYLGTQPLTDLNVNNGTNPATEGAQINDIIVDPDATNNSNNVLYVAKSTDGVFQLVQDADNAWSN